MATGKIIVNTRSTHKPKAKKVKAQPVESAPIAPVPISKTSVERVFQRLVKLAAIPGASGSPLISTESFYEANLYQLQDYLKHVLQETAKLIGDDAKTTLKTQFESVDWAF
jgi:hypothetical protein